MYLKTNSYTKLQVSIRTEEKSEKPKCNGQTDRQTNDEEIKSPPQVGRGLMITQYNEYSSPKSTFRFYIQYETTLN